MVEKINMKKFSAEEEARMLDKLYVSGLECNLRNLITILVYAYQKLAKQKKFERLVLTIGDTGSGKSTLNNSLVFGSESLEVKTISETIEV